MRSRAGGGSENNYFSHIYPDRVWIFCWGWDVSEWEGVGGGWEVREGKGRGPYLIRISVVSPDLKEVPLPRQNA